MILSILGLIQMDNHCNPFQIDDDHDMFSIHHNRSNYQLIKQGTYNFFCFFGNEDWLSSVLIIKCGWLGEINIVR